MRWVACPAADSGRGRGRRRPGPAARGSGTNHDYATSTVIVFAIAVSVWARPADGRRGGPARRRGARSRRVAGLGAPPIALPYGIALVVLRVGLDNLTTAYGWLAITGGAALVAGLISDIAAARARPRTQAGRRRCHGAGNPSRRWR